MHPFLYNLLWLRRNLSQGVAAMVIEVAETAGSQVLALNHSRTHLYLGRRREEGLRERANLVLCKLKWRFKLGAAAN
jgi:hypothetical protein